MFNQAFDGVDIIHVFLPFKLGEFAHDWARKHHVPLTAAFHLQPENVSSFIHLESSRALNDYLYDLFDQWLYYDVRHIHCPSKMIAHELKEHGYTAELHVISNGIPDAFKPGPGRDFGDGLTHIVTVGRLAKEKNQKTIIEGVGFSKFADTLQLHICGEGPLRHELEEVGRKLPHPPIFEYHSESDLIALLRSCPLYIHASTADIEAISVIEAFACGCVPIIGKAPMSAPAQFALLDESVFLTTSHRLRVCSSMFTCSNYHSRVTGIFLHVTSELLLSRAITSAPAPTATTAPNKIFAGILIAASFLLYACGWILGDSRF